MSDLIISVSGLRGVMGESLTPDIAVRYAQAFATGLPPGPMVVTRDGRESGPILVAALRRGLAAVGRDVIDAQIAATPTTGILVRQLEAAGGIQVSASHNPAEYNGMKLFSAAGRVVPADEGERVMLRFRSRPEATCNAIPLGSARTWDETTSAHQSLVEKIIDVDRIAQRQFRVLLDANHGCGAVLGRPLLESLGCQVEVVGGEPDGRFAHVPEPTATNLATILPRVVEASADIGFCQDPDADRLAVIDETGRYLGEEYTLAMCVEHVLQSSPGPVVTNCSTSRMTEDLADRFGVPFFRSAVGEANVANVMVQHDAVVGGEGNGGVIDPRVGLVRDSFVGMALLLESMAARDLRISQLRDRLPQYVMAKTKVPLQRDRLDESLAALERHFEDAKTSRLDGLRLDWPDRWLLVRASNTEPIVRLMAEGPTKAVAEGLCEEAQNVLGAA